MYKAIDLSFIQILTLINKRVVWIFSCWILNFSFDFSNFLPELHFKLSRGKPNFKFHVGKLKLSTEKICFDYISFQMWRCNLARECRGKNMAALSLAAVNELGKTFSWLKEAVNVWFSTVITNCYSISTLSFASNLWGTGTVFTRGYAVGLRGLLNPLSVCHVKLMSAKARCKGQNPPPHPGTSK